MFWINISLKFYFKKEKNGICHSFVNYQVFDFKHWLEILNFQLLVKCLYYILKHWKKSCHFIAYLMSYTTMCDSSHTVV